MPMIGIGAAAFIGIIAAVWFFAFSGSTEKTAPAPTVTISQPAEPPVQTEAQSQTAADTSRSSRYGVRERPFVLHVLRTVRD